LEAKAMTKSNDPKTFAEYINCLSILENFTSKLYRDISEKVDLPLVKSLLVEIALDSQKHSVILRGVSVSIAQSKGGQKDCEKKIGETWRMLSNLQKEIAKTDMINEDNFPLLSEKLSLLESTIGEEYYVFVQLKTLELMMKEINQMYNINLSSAKSIFMNIIHDEDHHREIIETIKQLITKKEPANNAPKVKFQNPDAWSRPMPSST
jgi:rubrerythrin